MSLFIAFVLLSLLGSGCGYFFSGLYLLPSSWWMLIVFALGSFVACYVLWLLFFFVGSLFISLKKTPKKPDRFAYWAIKETCQNLLPFVGARVKFVGLEKIPVDQKFLLICNHISGFDHLCLVAKIPSLVLSISKKENEDIFIAGKWMHKAGFLPLDRKNAFSGLQTIQQAMGYIERGEASVAVSPEGTRSKTGTLLPFHEGSFKIATRTGCPVVVVRVEGTSLIKKHFPFRSTKVTLTVLAVLKKEDYEGGTAVALSDRCHEILRSSYL